MTSNIKKYSIVIFCISIFALSSSAHSSTANSSAEKSHQLSRLASVNLCTDQFLLQFIPRERIVSLSYLATDPDYSAYSDKAAGIPSNHALAEELLPLKPDLVLATAYTPGSAVRLLRAQGIDVAELAIPNSIDDMVTFTAHIGELLGEKEQSQIIATQLRARLDHLEKTKTDHGTALVYAPNGYTGGANTVQDEILRRAGWKNLAAELGIEGYGNLPLETLVRNPPDLLIFDNSARNDNSLAQQLLHHPALKHMPRYQSIKLPTHLWLCSTPKLVDVIETLAALPPARK